MGEEGDGRGPFDEGPRELGDQRPMETDSSRYYETGRLNVAEGPPGKLPVILGDAPVLPAAGLTAQNFVCNAAGGRPACTYYAAILLPADGVARGFDEMQQIRRFCTRLATASELFELPEQMHGCSLRLPVWQPGIDRIAAFEERQRKVAEDAAQISDEIDY